MKKHMPGFVPVNFKSVGKILFIIGSIGLTVGLISDLTQWFFIHDYITYFSLVVMLISLYIILVGTKD